MNLERAWALLEDPGTFVKVFECFFCKTSRTLHPNQKTLEEFRGSI